MRAVRHLSVRMEQHATLSGMITGVSACLGIQERTAMYHVCIKSHVMHICVPVFYKRYWNFT